MKPHRHLITARPITPATTFSATAGAVVDFHGVVRSEENGRTIRGIDYECFQALADKEFARILDQAHARWPLERTELVHRIGRVAAGEASLWIRTSAPHRREALEACAWIIEEMKRTVPIWKRPY